MTSKNLQRLPACQLKAKKKSLMVKQKTFLIVKSMLYFLNVKFDCIQNQWHSNTATAIDANKRCLIMRDLKLIILV